MGYLFAIGSRVAAVTGYAFPTTGIVSRVAAQAERQAGSGGLTQQGGQNSRNG